MAQVTREVQLRHDVAAAQRVSGMLAGLIVRWRRQLAAVHHAAHPGEWTMYDAVDVREIPPNAQAVAGYIDGRWANFEELTLRYPHAHRLSIAVDPLDDADCLDVESGDATVGQAVPWLLRQLNQDAHRPCVYGSRSTMSQIVPRLRAAGIRRSEIRLWVADPTGHPHIPAGFDACQWWWGALGRDLDQSACLPTFFTTPLAKR